MILALDIGTTNFKAGIFDQGKLIKVCEIPLEVIDGYKTNAKTWRNAFKAIMLEFGKSLDLTKIRTICLDGNGPTLVSMPSGNSLLWLDRRAEQESKEISEKLGYFLDSSFLLPKILRQKRHNTTSYNNTSFYLGSADYLAYELTGQARIVMALEGLERWYWNDEILSYFKIDKTKIPAFIKMGEKIGNVTTECAKEFGIKTIPVISGPPDFVTAILGSGCTEEGMVCDRAGTSEGINLCTKTKNFDERLMCYRHPNGKDWNISGIISTSGKAIEYVKNLLGNMDYPTFYKLAEISEAGCNGLIFHPYLAGERAPIWDSKATGSFTGLTINTNKSDFARSACEGVCYCIKDVLKTMNYPVKQIRVTGAPAQSDFLNQLKADILQLPVVITSSPYSDLVGLAVLCYTAIGDYENIEDCAKVLVKEKKVFTPDQTKKELYEKGYKRFKDIYKAIKVVN